MARRCARVLRPWNALLRSRLDSPPGACVSRISAQLAVSILESPVGHWPISVLTGREVVITRQFGLVERASRAAGERLTTRVKASYCSVVAYWCTTRGALAQA